MDKTDTNKFDIIDIIAEFFTALDLMTNSYIDRVEIEPIRVSDNIYLSGFRRKQFSSFEMEAHLKDIKSFKVNTLANEVLMEADNEIWLPLHLIRDTILEKRFDKFLAAFNATPSFTILHVQYKVKGKDMRRREDIIFSDKKMACKEALAFRKIYEEVTNKLEYFTMNAKGNLLETKEPTEFELATAAVVEA